MDRTTTSEALIACLPPVAYNRQAVQVGNEVAVLAALVDQGEQRADDVLTEQQADLTSAALGDWERNYNLPDPCLGPSATFDQRRVSLLAKLVGLGDLSRSHMIEIAAALGYTGCTVTEFGPMTCADACDSAVNGEDFIGVWRLNVPAATLIQTATCASPSNVALRSWGNAQLECVIGRRKPAHTIALFGYAEGDD